jgi:hypothetical protein
MSRDWARLERGAVAVWQGARTRYLSQVAGPHFESLCREYRSGVVTDSANRTKIEIDVEDLGPAEPGRPRRVLSLGEVKWDRVMDGGHLARLRRARDLLAVRGSIPAVPCSPATQGSGSQTTCEVQAVDRSR